METDGATAFPCQHCTKSFSRHEHLQRHTQRHTGLRPFACSECGKAFPRRDTLRRHITIHGQTAVENYEESMLRLRGKPAACSSCAKAKQACDSQHPCSRCQKKQAVCVYGTREQRPNRREQAISSPSVASSSTSQNVIAVDNASVLLSTLQGPLQVSQDVGQMTTYSVPESQHTSLRTTLPENVPDASDETHQPVVDHLDPSFTTDVLPDIDLDCLLLDNLPEPSFPTFDLTSFILWQSDATSGTQQEEPCRTLDGFEATPGREDQTQETEQLPSPSMLKTSLSQEPYKFPDIQPEQIQSFCRHIYTHIPQIETTQHAHLKASEFFYSIQSSHKSAQGPRPTFLPFSVFNAFVQLYFEHFHPIRPFIHPSMLAKPHTSWILCVGMATVGSRYTTVEPINRCRSALMSLHSDAILKSLPKVAIEGDLSFYQSVLLRHISLAYEGSLPRIMEISYERSLLTTLCYNRIATRARPRGHNLPEIIDHTQWENWVAAQSDYWFIYSVWLFECLTKIFFDIRPQMNTEDLEVPLPQTGSLWNATDRLEWVKVFKEQPRADQVSGGDSLKTALYDSDAMQKIAAGIDGLLRILLITTLFVEESVELQLAKSRLTERASNPSILARTRNPTTRQFFERDIPLRLQNRIKDMDTEFNFLQPSSHACPSADGLSIMDTCIYHKIQIIRHVHLQGLYALAGWKASKAHVDVAERDFRLWLSGPKPTIRKCVWHAAVLFSTLHSRRDMALWEPMCFLTGTMFMWAYLKYADDRVVQGSSADCVTRNQKALRLDRLTSEDEMTSWIEHGFSGDVHVTGIGNLIPGECPNRVLDELAKCLLAQTGTANLSSGIAKAVMRICHGLPASD
ncbi:hypothetical protein FOVG_17994 [Fusarium oxysporum f. sp. pisi HDV247]|uniref:Uncharacterized protein n=1 Tax=Fusarium oxysporum f. sp. pisi HDV247 TaxID=1080344 RepID=W9NS86_FUSOX|nr:hypothetical protein FOVG_17994 [Fusarium oxysporum f. sp. pisi HDV247]